MRKDGWMLMWNGIKVKGQKKKFKMRKRENDTHKERNEVIDWKERKLWEKKNEREKVSEEWKLF